MVKDLPTGPSSLSGGEVVASNAIEMVYDLTAGEFHLVSYPASSVPVVDVTQTFSLSGTITPTILSTSTNDWAPSGLGTATVIRSSANTAINLTGLAAPTAHVSGRVIVLQNIGSSTITLTANDALSSTADRFNLDAPFQLAPAQSVTLIYDATTTNWRRFDYSNAPPVAAQFKNLTVQAITATGVTITADEVSLEDANNDTVRAHGVNVTCLITAVGANGLDTGAEAASTWYSTWVIYNATTNTQACLLSISATGPTMPAGYTFKARFGWVRNDGSSNFYRFLQKGRRVQYTVGSNPAGTLVMANGVGGTYSTTAPVWASVAVIAANGAPSFVPSTASSILGAIGNRYNGGAAADVIAAPNGSYAGPVSTNLPPVSVDNNEASIITPFEFELESANIFWASANTGGVLLCTGYTDNL